MDDLIAEFLTESNESLSQLDIELIELEQRPDDPELLGNIFRLVHTIKGTCGFLGLARLEKLAHSAENVLGKFRDRELTVTPDSVSLILQAIDGIKAILLSLENDGEEPAGDDAGLIAKLDACAAGALEAAPEVTAVANDTVGPVDADDEAMMPEPAADPAVVALHPVEGAAAGADDEAESDAGLEPAVAEATDAPAETSPDPAAAKGDKPKDSAVSNQSIRVNVELLETLMTTVSELVLTRNQLLQILRNEKDSAFSAPLQRLNQVTSEIQEGVMKTRMQPIGNAWSKLPRIVRDLSREMGKKITLDMRGQETELDRQVLELIKDPLTHMVRNSADHGIETPEQRLAAGKPEGGTIRLNAYHEGGHIIIQIADDGKGLPVERLRAKAIASGLVEPEEAAAMTDQQVHQLIFHAGLSTAEQVTNVSGRGVGMDVVRTNIEQIGGTIDLKSAEGEGTTFTIKIPLTLAIVSALIVEAGGERFAIPQISVVELVRSAGETQRIERINGAAVLRLRDRLLPLVSLRDILGLPNTSEDRESDRYIVVTQVGANSFGIIVDRVFDTEEIVVKPVARFLRDIDAFSGNTILGDGSVIMILDPNGLANRTVGMGLNDQPGAAAGERNAGNDSESTSLLLFRAGQGAPKAVPLSLVARLEDIPVDSIEVTDGRPVVQYRGEIMPLVTCDPGMSMRSEGKQSILVFADRQRVMGLMVEEILDIVDTVLDVEHTSTQPGLIGSAVVAGKTTEVIDVTHYLKLAFNDWFGAEEEAFGREAQSRRVLLVDDSPFFRNLLSPLLSVAGYDVTTAESADQALTMVQNGDCFDIVVSDIEMPGTDGFGFAEKLRADQRFANLPVIALSSHNTPEDLSRGRAVGFNDYVAKLDRDALLRSLSETLAEAKGAA